MSSTSVADFLDTNVLVYSVAFYDSAIVAAALEAGCKHPPSEDLQHGQRIEGLRIENPFRSCRR